MRNRGDYQSPEKVVKSGGLQEADRCHCKVICYIFAMKHFKQIIFLGLTLLLLLSAMFALSILAGRGGRPLLLASPTSFGTQGINQDAIAQFCEKEFLVTYELRQNKNVVASQGSHAIILIGTNSHYRDVMGYGFLDGGFFTKAAYSAGYRHAVLNKAAAFKLFGGISVSGNTFKMDGETWSVAGVIDDLNDDSSNIYVPSSFAGGRPQSLMTLLDSAKVSETYAKNALKTLGVRDSGYDFINFSKTVSMFWGRFYVSWKAALCLTILLIGRVVIARMAGLIPVYREKLKRMYLRELISENRAVMLKMTGSFILLLAGAGAVLTFSLQILGTFLGLRESTLPSGKITVQDFSRLTDSLKAYHTAGIILFTIYFFVLTLLFVTVWRQSRLEQNKEELI